MPIHNFSDQPHGIDLFGGSGSFKKESEPSSFAYPTGVSQRSHVETQSNIAGDTGPTSIQEVLQNGFFYLDEAMQKYWSNIRVPTTDSYRFMRVKVSGGDRSLLVWKDELRDGRVKLPVAALDRTSHEFNVAKYSPPYLAMAKKYTSRRSDMMLKVYRPIPFLVSYTLAVWAEHKTDIEHIAYQIITRFNPLAEFIMQDSRIYGSITLRSGGFSDASSKEASSEEDSYTRYEFPMIAEAWLPLPEKLTPTILGNVKIVKELSTGLVLWAQSGSDSTPTSPIME